VDRFKRELRSKRGLHFQQRDADGGSDKYFERRRYGRGSGPDGGVLLHRYVGQPAGGVVGGEWAYKNGLSGAPQGANAGISSAGFSDTFGTADLFPGPNLAGPLGPDGIQYGILSAGDNTATGNLHIFGGLIKNSVTFQLSGATADDFASIKDVSFQYGRNLTDTNLVAVPEPASALLVAAGLVALGARRGSARAA
jgi:hypothetical protein